MPHIARRAQSTVLCVGTRRLVVAVRTRRLVALACVYVPTWSGSHDAGTGHLANAFDIHEGPLVTDHPGEAQPGLGDGGLNALLLPPALPRTKAQGGIKAQGR